MSLNIFFSTDINEYMGVLACINSIIKNTQNLEKINIYVLTFDMKSLTFPIFPINVYIKDLIDYPNLKNELELSMSKHNPLRINNIANFARFTLPLIFENIDHGLYLDADMIVNTDIYNILKEIPKSFNICACQNYDLRKMGLRLDGQGFNAGIFYWNFAKYRKNNFYRKAIEIMQQNRDKKKQIKFGTQNILNEIYYAKVHFINPMWNIMGFGAEYEKYLPSEEDIKNGFIYHWTGEKKPWKEDGNYKELWLKYKI